MKTILVDAWNTLVFDWKIHKEIQELLDTFSNPKIVLTNATPEKQIQLGLVNLPYPLFSLSNNPSKTDPKYFETMLNHFSLNREKVVYFEHNLDAVKSAQSLGIEVYHYDASKRDIEWVKSFLEQNL